MWQYNITLVDNGGNRLVKRYNLVAADYATAASDAAAILAALQNVTNCAIAKTTLQEVTSYTYTLPVDGVQKENQAAISASLVAKDQSFVFYIPAPIIDIFIAQDGEGADIVDTSDALLVAYFNELSAKTLVSDGDALDKMISGKRIHKASKRG